MINKQFPSSYDVEQTLCFGNTGFEDAKRFLRQQGLIHVGNKKSDLAEAAANILFDHQTYIVMRALAQGASAATNISGFTLRAKIMPLNSDVLLQDITSLRSKLNNEKPDLIKKGSVVKELDMPLRVKGSSTITTNFKYQRLIPGRVELMHRVDSNVELTIEEINQLEWRVLCYPEANQDVSKVEELFGKMSSLYEPFRISLDDFTRQQRISFFDQILNYYTHENREWEFIHVTGIVVKQEEIKTNSSLFLEEDVDTDLEPDESIDEQPSESDLLSISEAVLQGRNLRNNSFIKKCESQGFYFSSMTLELSNKHSAEIIEVIIRFKFSPKMFEVVLSGMSERNNLGKPIASAFPNNRQRAILKEFWNTSHEIWKDVEKQVPKEAGTNQITMADYLRTQELQTS